MVTVPVSVAFSFLARSPVFSAMFEHEMEESKKVCAGIKACLLARWLDSDEFSNLAEDLFF